MAEMAKTDTILGFQGNNKAVGVKFDMNATVKSSQCNENQCIAIFNNGRKMVSDKKSGETSFYVLNKNGKYEKDTSVGFLTKPNHAETMPIMRTVNKDAESMNAYPDGILDNFEQGYVGDCALLSTAIAINVTDSGNTVRNMVSVWPENHKEIVTVKTPEKQYKMPLKDLKNRDDLSTGDADIRAIECAYEQKLAQEHPLKYKILSAIFPKKFKSILDGESPDRPFEFLTDKKVQIFSKYKFEMQPADLHKLVTIIPKSDIDPMKTQFKTALTLKEKYPHKFAMTTVFKEEKGQMLTDHGFAISKVEKDFVTIIDPHDTSKEIKIPKREFVENVYMITSCDMKQK